MTQDIDPREPVDRYTEADFSEFHKWTIDDLGGHKHFSELKTNPIDEVVQNCFDSCDKGVLNNISLMLGRSTDPHQPFLTVTDEGPHGICKDYHGDITEFMAAKKATTNKGKRDLQRKGLGMFSYPNLGSPVIITSMDNDFIHRIPVFRDKEGYNGFGKVVTKPNKGHYPQEFRMYQNGTRVAWFNRHPEIDPLSAITIRKSISEKFGLKLYDNQKVHVYVDDKEVQMPAFIQEHPPQVMAVSHDGVRNHDIRGHIWGDPTGNGRINVYQDGYLVEALQIDGRKVKGYIEYNVLLTNPERNAFLPSPQLSELKQWLKKQMDKYPKVEAPVIDKREKDAAIEAGIAILGKYLQNFTSPGGLVNHPSKLITTTTDLKGDDVIGYPFNPEGPANPGNGNGTRIQTEPTNPNNVGKIGSGLGEQHGGAAVKVQDPKPKGPRRVTNPMEYTEVDMGPNSPLWHIQRGTGIKGVPMLVVNIGNAEYPMYKKMPGGVTKSLLTAVWLSEISMNEASQTKNGLPDHYRMKHSRFRVEAWNAMNLFPRDPSDKEICNPRGRRYL